MHEASVSVLIALAAVLVVMLLAERRRRRRAEMELRQRTFELVHINRRSTIGELSASIAHELYQPLGAILRNSEAAELALGTRCPDLPYVKDILADIKRDEHRASEIIRRLRRLLANAPLEAHEVNLNEVVREVFEFLSAQALARRVTLSTSLDPRAPRTIGDRIQLQQVILNLVMNGIEAIESDASAERKIIGHTAVLNDTSMVVTLEDSGPGISPEMLKIVFEPFFTTKEAGMGMGLAIARTIVESHSGRMWVENRRTGGALLRFSLPLANPTQTRQAPCSGAELDQPLFDR